MLANVMEWTFDCCRGDCARHVLCGGSWESNDAAVRPSVRTGYTIALRGRICGFPVVRTLE